MALRHIEVISIPVSDQDVAIEFYRDKLGFKLITDSVFDEGMRWVQLAVDDSPTTITLVTWFENLKPGAVQGLILATDDIATSFNALKDAGVSIEPIYDTPWGRFASFRDPDGNGWSLHQG